MPTAHITNTMVIRKLFPRAGTSLMRCPNLTCGSDHNGACSGCLKDWSGLVITFVGWSPTHTWAIYHFSFALLHYTINIIFADDFSQQLGQSALLSYRGKSILSNLSKQLPHSLLITIENQIRWDQQYWRVANKCLQPTCYCPAARGSPQHRLEHLSFTLEERFCRFYIPPAERLGQARMGMGMGGITLE